MVRRRQVSPANSMTKLRKPTCKPIYSRTKTNKLLAGLGSVRIVKNYDLGLENAALGLRPGAAFSRPRSQFFTMRTSQPANNIYGRTIRNVMRGRGFSTCTNFFSAHYVCRIFFQVKPYDEFFFFQTNIAFLEQ